ncbi:hypothetical protein Q5P01_004231 [Channa striata]|uniref:Uncharacterized protein n=1 Tax=Channa striata TaxID=64152 RepID=A0AA88NNU5_CHASR|nr:hypothetical protein Q5P01_004231 [Channa striata]
MTVEMRVRLTIKEEETIHWTTTVTRSSVANQLNETCLPESEAEQEICSPQSNSLDLQSPTASTDTINKDKSKDNDDEDPPSPSNGVFNESSDEEDNFKVQTDAVSPRRAPTPGHKHVRKKQASVESITSVTAEGIQEDMAGSYFYRKQVESGALTEQYCMLKQSTKRPVPKPRRLGSLDANTTNSRNASIFKSAEMTETLQIESSGEEVTETVLHIFEQQSGQDNFLANMCTQGITALSMPATPEGRHVFSMDEFEPELCRPFTASESTSNWRAESMSVISDFTLPSLKTGGIKTTNRKQKFPRPEQREGNKGKRTSTKPKVVNQRVWQLTSPGKRPKEKHKKVKTFSSAGFIKRIYGNKSKSAKSMKHLKKRPTHYEDRVVTSESLRSLDDTVKSVVKDPNVRSQLKENTSKTVSLETSSVVTQPKGILTWQTSIQQETDNEACDIIKSMSLSGVNSSSSVTKEYIEKWLENAHHNPTVDPDGESKTLNKTENGILEDLGNNAGLMAVVEEVMCTEQKHEKHTCQTRNSDPGLATSIKLRIQSFENKSSVPQVEKTTATQQIGHGHADTTKTENSTGVAQHNTEEIKPIPNNGLFGNESGEEINQESSECDLSTCEGHLEQGEEHNQTSPSYYVELNFNRKESIPSPSPPNTEKDRGIQKSCVGLNGNSTDDSDVDERPSSEDEQPCQELMVRIEESLEEEQEIIEEEEHLDLPAQEKDMKTCKKLQALIEETEEDMVRPDDITTSQNAVGGEQSIFIENLDLYTRYNNSTLTKSDSLSKHCRSNADEDSGNDHSSCEEQLEVEKPKIKDEQIGSSTEEKLSYYEKEFKLEKERGNMDRHIEVHAMVTETEDAKGGKAVVKHPTEEAVSQSVAERVSLLEKQVAEARRENINLESDLEDSPSESPTSQSALCTRSAPQSSLSFSYDSSGVITTEPEGSRVRSIREMFLAKSSADIQHGNRCPPGPNAPKVSQLRTQTSASGGYQSQTSSELSTGEDDSAHKSISKDKKTFSRKCTYFSLPHASDSDVCQDDQSSVSKSSVNGDSTADTKDKPEDTNTWAERNTMLPAAGVTDFKMMDNKVHPLTEGPSESEAVVVQPGKGQGVINRRLQEPDMLDFLYNFCGQHCPIL